MAKRRASSSSRSRSSARKTARGGARSAGKSTRKTAARKSSRQAGRRKTAARKTTRTGAAKKSARGTVSARKTARKPATAKSAPVRRTAGATTANPRTPPRKAPSLNRPRRTVDEDDLVPTPPSSLDLDRSASAVRTGRREMKERRDELTQTSPALTGGDVDADWESAYSVGDEAPGGDNPTPDQDIVDDIGRAVGVEYEDNEELKGADKVAKRDRHRWELDPASSEDYNDRD
jgi:hypothetical protein